MKRKVYQAPTEEDAYEHQKTLHNNYNLSGNGSFPRPVGHGKRIATSRQAKGFTLSEEARAKISEKKRGRIPSEAERQRSRETYPHDRINSREAIEKRDAKRRGSKRTEASKLLMSIAAKKRFARMSEVEKVRSLQVWIEAGQKAANQVTKDTSLERKVEEILKASGVTYVKQLQVSYYSCDFYVPATNTVIEANGCYVHQCPVCGYNNRRTEEIRTRDARKIAYLESKGYTVNVIWEHSFEGYKLRGNMKG